MQWSERCGAIDRNAFSQVVEVARIHCRIEETGPGVNHFEWDRAAYDLRPDALMRDLPKPLRAVGSARTCENIAMSPSKLCDPQPN